jgi:hypothetical protein
VWACPGCGCGNRYNLGARLPVDKEAARSSMSSGKKYLDERALETRFLEHLRYSKGVDFEYTKNSRRYLEEKD